MITGGFKPEQTDKCSVSQNISNSIYINILKLIDRPSAAKRLKGESLLPHVHAADSVPNSQKVIQNFLTAFKCYELLHSSQELQRGKVSSTVELPLK